MGRHRSLRCASLRGCGRRCGELGDVLEVRRESGQEVVFGGGRWGRNGGTVALLRLLSVGAPAGEGTQNINRGPSAAMCKNPSSHYTLCGPPASQNLPQRRERRSAVLGVDA